MNRSMASSSSGLKRAWTRFLNCTESLAHSSFDVPSRFLKLSGPQPDSFKNRLGTTKEEWAKLSVQLRNRVQARFNPEELDAIDRFILLASQGSVFDHVCR